MSNRLNLTHRPRRLRQNASIRGIVSETSLRPMNLVQPFFMVEGTGVREPISSLPGQFRLSVDELEKAVLKCRDVGIPAIALFPKINDADKSEDAKAAYDDNGLVPMAIKRLKSIVPEVLVIGDIALDPYSSLGQDGIVEDGVILNDETIEVLVQQAICQARAGVDMVAPSDMMDGRIGAIRQGLDKAGFQDVMIMAYSAKYASSFYGPFRDALDSAPRGGADKKTYQMDPANSKEAIYETTLDIEEGADIVMVKPALPYLDIVRDLATSLTTPIAAYHVSGEYAMLKAAALNGWLDDDACMLESLTAIRRAGATMIFTYAALDLCERGLIR